MSAGYDYPAPDGRKLHVARREADGALELAIVIPPSDGMGISIPASDVPSVLEGIRVQAGLPDRWQLLRDWLKSPALDLDRAVSLWVQAKMREIEEQGDDRG